MLFNKNFFKDLLVSSCGIFIFTQVANAQVTPDITLPFDSTVTSDSNNFVVQGGTEVGSNLFHSFEQFSIPTGSVTYFNNSAIIQNIFSRVTGNSVSSIDGLIRVNGTANLFLLNPNGIIFGPNAELNIGGSFLGSTAERINFSNGTVFSAVLPEYTPLLTVDLPIGLGFGSNPGEIIIQGTGHALSFVNPTLPIGSPIAGAGRSPTGLRTAPEKTLALLGGPVTFEGGILSAPSGQIEVGSVADGIVTLSFVNSGFSLKYDGASSLQNIQLNRNALIDASGTANGRINILGKNLEINDGSIILVSKAADPMGGKINIKTVDYVKLNGITDPSNFYVKGNFFDLRNNSDISSSEIIRGIISQSFANAKGADIKIDTKDLIVQNFSAISTNNYGTNKGGNIEINLSGELQIIGAPPVKFLFLPSFISTANFSSGRAGDIKISGNLLNIREGGLLLSQSFGSGNGGNIFADFSSTVDIAGGFTISPAANAFVHSALATTALSTGNAGDVFINTKELIIEDGGRVSAATAALGTAGNITINASELVNIRGKISDSKQDNSFDLSQISSAATQTNNFFIRVFNLPNVPLGKAGSINIKTKKISIQDEGKISVISEGLANAGEILIESSKISLDAGGISATTTSGEGGDISLRSRQLQLQNGSTISATAGLVSGTGNGGNITIDTDTLTALKGSKIIANAFQGRGGNIQITTSGLFLSPDSKITATSDLGIDGAVNIQTLGIEPEDAIVPLVNNFIPTEQAIASSCLDRRNQEQGTFVVTGSGGLPSSPFTGVQEWERTEPAALVSDSSSQRERSLSTPDQSLVTNASNWKEGDPVVEAQGIIHTSNGRVLLGMSPEASNPMPVEKLICQGN